VWIYIIQSYTRSKFLAGKNKICEFKRDNYYPSWHDKYAYNHSSL
jgi:hypothetical protein